MEKRVFLRKPLSKTNLRYHIRNLFKNEYDLSSVYIAIQTTYSDNKLSNQFLGKTYYINFQNDNEKINYIDYITDLYSNMSKKDVKKIKTLSFKIVEATEKEHNNFLRESI